MNRIKNIEIENAPQPVAELYQAVENKLGLVPNMVKALGNSPAALQGYLGLSGAVANGKLATRTREKIALLVAERNGCDYCLSAHSAIAGSLKVPQEEIESAREGRAQDTKEQAILSLAGDLLDYRGEVPENRFAGLREAGVTDEEATEVVTNVALNLLTNYFNRFARTDIDFPVVRANENVIAAA
ncbi:MAG: carboxymuconolactone decarboxylase family protein [Verrucomicrobiales bacterium]|nr:carboxymuconolactone decarboxylase family protein [Verrucomicrobiales bacterium]